MIHGSSRGREGARAGRRGHICQAKTENNISRHFLVGVTCNDVVWKKCSVPATQTALIYVWPMDANAPSPCTSASGRSVPRYRNGEGEKSTNHASAGLQGTDAPEPWKRTLLLEISMAEMVGRPASPHVKSQIVCDFG